MSVPKKKSKKVTRAKAPSERAVARARPTPVAAPSESAPKTAASVTRETLNQTVTRAVAMLRAIGTSDTIRAAMSSRGYDDAEHERGWSLVHRASGYKPGTIPPPAMASTAGAAIANIDAEDEGTFRVVKASLTHRHPAQADFVLKGLTPSKGARAVVTMRLLLDRLDALENGRDREATRADDHAALAVLTRRGITPEFRRQMRAEVRTAETFNAVALPRVDTTAREEQHLADLQELRAWYEEWSEISRVVLTRKDLLIRMGLAQRKGKKGKTTAKTTGGGKDPVSTD